MKKSLVIALAVLIGVVFVATVFAQTATEKATKAATDAATEKGKAAGDKATQAVTGKSTTPATDKAGKEESAPCKQIAEICKKAGFTPGDASKGHGLHRDCINPIMQKKTIVPGAKKPLPVVDPKLVAECKANNPEYGSGKVGSKQ